VANTRLESNERLELLGDAVLGMVICDELFRRFAEWLEGDLTRVKSTLVSRRVCAQVSDATGLTSLLILGNGIEAGSRLPVSVRAAVLESVVGAVYVDGGLEPARQFILRSMAGPIEKCVAGESHDNYKSALQQYTQRWMSATPHYLTLDEQGPDHSKCFEVCVVINGRRFPSAWGPNKKHAEQEAARKAMEKLTAAQDSAAQAKTG
jgi:ribonuclease-3